MIAEALKPLAVSMDSLVMDESNLRKHGEKNLSVIKKSLEQFGQRQPIVVQKDGMIIRAGNGRYAAAKELGWTEIAAIVIDEPAENAQAFALADNRSAELADWNQEALASLLADLDEVQREGFGFDQDDVRKLVGDLDAELADFEPELEPDIAPAGDVTDSELEDAAESVADVGSEPMATIEVACPECAHVFEIQKP